MHLPRVCLKFMNIKNDSGGITVLVLVAILAVLTLLPFAGLAVNGYLMANQLNQTADRVALAAARQLIDNPESACLVGSELAQSNGVELVICETEDDEVTIKVKADSVIQNWLDRWPNVGMARAGIDYLSD